MRESLLARYLITATERVNLVTRHLKGEINKSLLENPTVQKDKESLNIDLLLILLKGLEKETQILKQELESRR